MEHGPDKKDLGVVMDGKLVMSWKCALEVQKSQLWPGIH